MKFILALLLLTTYACSLPPTNLVQQEGTRATTFNFVTPNKQATKTGGIDALIETGNKNLLENPSFEHTSYQTGWTYTGAATASQETSIVLSGKKSFKITAAGNSFRLEQKTTLYAAQLAGQQGIMSVWVKNNDPATTICPIVDDVDIAALCLTASVDNEWKEYVIPFVMGATNSGLVVKAGTSAGTIYIDDAHVGIMPATMTPEVAQAEYFGGLVADGATNCAWIISTDTFSSFAADSDCNEFTEIGNAKKPSTKIPAVVIPAGSPSGVYEITPKFRFQQTDTSAAYSCLFRLTDGVNFSLPEHGATNDANDPSGNTGSYNTSWSYSYTTKNVDTLIQAQARSSGSGLQCILQFTNPLFRSGFDVYYYPPKNKIYSNKSMGWYVDVNIGGANPSLGTSNVSTYTEITNGSLDMVINPGSQPAQIPCSSTNPSTGLTCAAGNESVGVVFDIPSVGTYEVCGSFSHAAAVPNSTGTIASTFQFVETAMAAQTIIQSGKSTTTSRVRNGDQTTPAAVTSTYPHKNCAVFKFNSVGQKTVRLMYEQLVSGTASSSLLQADRDVAIGQPDLHIVVRPLINNEQITASFKQIDDELEEVYVYAHSSGLSVPLGFQAAVFGTKVIDTKNAYNSSTGVFTAPRDGVYSFSSTLAGTVNMTTGQQFAVGYRINSTDFVCGRVAGTGASSERLITCSSIFKLNQGDTLVIRAASDVNFNLANTEATTNFKVVRIPSK